MRLKPVRSCLNCATAVHRRERVSICVRSMNIVTAETRICDDFVPAYIPVKYTGECVSVIKEKVYGIN